MDGFGFPLFVLAAFAGGFVSGFSGFAMGLVVSGVWLHIITPLQTATLIAGYGLLTWSGFKLYGKIDDETFRKAVLILLLLAGLSLIAPALIFRAP